MSQVTIVPGDDTVVVDGEAKEIDCSEFESLEGLNAVQWNGDMGHVEYINDIYGDPADFKPNTMITSVEPFQPVIDAWHAKPAPEPFQFPPPPA